MGSVPHGVRRVGNSIGSLDVGGWKKGMLQKNLIIFRREGFPNTFHSPYLSDTGVTQFSVRLNSLGFFWLPLPLIIISPNDIYC
jgi:hypothetical protein